MVAGGLWENGEMATGDEFDALLVEAGRTPMRGWEYDYGGRIRLEPPPWDFPGRMLERCRAAASLLDMGTGGGEWLSRLPYRPPLTVATEGWAPNLEIARGRLEPLGIRVVEVEGAPDNHRQGREGDGGGALPFADGTFDLVGNRHESYLPSEVRRVLAPGGCFLTQQVAGDFNREFYALLGEPAPTPEAPHWNLGFARAQLEAAELPPVAGGEGWEVLHFADVGALAWYLLNLPWVFPGFPSGATASACAACTRAASRWRCGSSSSGWRRAAPGRARLEEESLHQLGAAARAGLAEQVEQVGLHRRQAESEALSQAFVADAVAQQQGDLPFPRCQALQALGAGRWRGACLRRQLHQAMQGAQLSQLLVGEGP